MRRPHGRSRGRWRGSPRVEVLLIEPLDDLRGHADDARSADADRMLYCARSRRHEHDGHLAEVVDEAPLGLFPELVALASRVQRCLGGKQPLQFLGQRRLRDAPVPDAQQLDPPPRSGESSRSLRRESHRCAAARSRRGRAVGRQRHEVARRSAACASRVYRPNTARRGLPATVR